MKIGVEYGEVGDAGKELEGLAHDVDGDGCMQRRESCVAIDLVDELRRDELVLVDGGPAADHAMADGRRGREVGRSGARRQPF